MASKSASTSAPRPRPWWSPGWRLAVWAMVIALLIPTLGFALWVLFEAGGQTEIDAQTLTIARQNAAGPVTAITGTEHTVYHANNALPDAKSPRPDDALTLVWFTSTTCKACEDTTFVHQVMKDFRFNVVFMEKAVDREPAAERLGIKDVPAFVWLEREGNELGRFTDIANEAAFRAEVERMIAAEFPAD